MLLGISDLSITRACQCCIVSDIQVAEIIGLLLSDLWVWESFLTRRTKS